MTTGLQDSRAWLRTRSAEGSAERMKCEETSAKSKKFAAFLGVAERRTFDSPSFLREPFEPETLIDRTATLDRYAGPCE